MEDENKAQGEPLVSPTSEEKEPKQYNPTFEHASTVFIGDGHSINNSLSYNDVKEIAQDILNNSIAGINDRIRTEVSKALQEDNRHTFKQVLAENLSNLRHSDDDLGSSPPSVSLGEEELPEDLEKWFYTLSIEKQYTVQAIAILHGGKVHEISQVREQLIALANEQSISLSDDSSITSQVQISPFQSSSDFYSGTHTELRFVYGTERVFLRDTTSQGTSTFRIRLLHFLSREALRGGWGTRGQHMLTVTTAWAESARGDSYWRAAQALGVIWCKDFEQLQRLANTWATSNLQRDWRRVASLLYGAYEFEQTLGTEVGLPRSQITRILKQWIERTHSYKNNSVGCAVAYTYGLLARRSPEIALQGLDDLLKFSLQPALPSSQQGIPLVVFVALISNYVNFVWLGHLRLLINHIASWVRELIQNRTKEARPIQQAQQKFQRTIVLETLFTVFFLIAGESLPTSEKAPTTHDLHSPLQEPVRVPGLDGRDTLLVGLLATDASGWRHQIAQIVCGAVVEHKSQITFDFLQHWTRQVLQEQGEKRQNIYTSLVHFFTEIDELLVEWTQHRPNQKARDTFWRRLHSWQQKSPLLKTFVDDVRIRREQQLNSGR